MVVFKNIVAIIAAIIPFSAAAPVTDRAPNKVEGKYIITLKNGTSSRAVDSHLEWVSDVHERSLGRRALNLAGVERKYAIGNFHGYAGSFDDATVEEIRNNPEVRNVEPDQIYTITGITTQSSATYGLATISSRSSGSSIYRYDTSGGKGTFAYIIDTGINIEHVEFEGRAQRGYNAAGGDFTDADGHGTHVAGIIGSKTYGVAKHANLIDVKVFTGKDAEGSVILDGYQWAVQDIRNKGRESRAVINMSLDGPRSEASNSAIEAAFQAGILTVVAAGNNDSPTHNSSPASAANAITVGAIDSSWIEWPKSNYGPEVDVLAPGVSILSTYRGSNTETRSMTGTSMATPHVAGLALYLAALEDIETPSDLTARIKKLGTRGQIRELKSGNPNLIPYNGYS